MEGDTLVIAGPSGSGKSTISYAINGIIPYRMKGLMKGNIKIFGKSIWDYSFSELCKNVGLVKQNPIDQLVTFTVRDEIAFGLENLKYPKEEIEERIQEITDFMDISHLLDRDITQLSGGQKQLTILCSFLVMKPRILILDEPIAFLDQQSESLLLSCLRKLIKSDNFKITLIIIEHRLSRILDFADKIVLLDEDGHIKLKGNVKDIIFNQFKELKSCNVRVPWLHNVFHGLNTNLIPINFENSLEIINSLSQEDLKQLRQILINTEIQPQNIKDFQEYKEKIDFENTYIEKLREKSSNLLKSKSELSEKSNTLLETKELVFEYPNTCIKAINKLSIKINEGDFIGLVGPNGSGKTTLLYLLANLYEPSSGEILFKNNNLNELDTHDYSKNIGFIFQNPENMIFKRTIKDEILYGPHNFGIINVVKENYLNKLISLIGNEPPNKNPFELSWGQKRRLNLSSIFVYNPELILLDEPFIGQDQKTIDALVETLYIENKRGKTIIISSHDYHLLLKYTTKIIELNKDGTLKTHDVIENYFKTHSTLGPYKLLNKINERINGGKV